ncbi:efflux RND transporter periplasmic adaptor subunit [Negadavirga shengliensis]|uniref:Efflux RND transporter periplasmic adaptor subunit n=1 Tax=Negadavirga shengliensis TaxID=1389218 RepID=A0ABV9SWH6_9BACT
MRNILLLISLAILVMSGCKNEHHETHGEANFIVTLPEIKDTTIYKEYIGQVRSIQHIELRALEKGYLQDIYVDEGQSVKKGQLLFQIMPVIYQAEMQKAEAETNFAEIEYQNTKSLADSNIVSQNELALAKATYEKARAEMLLAEAHLQFTEIRAPFDGIVGRFNEVRPGSLMEEGELLTTLSDNSKMWVYYNVPEAEYLDFVTENDIKNANQQVKLKMANGKFFDLPGVVETIEADFNNETGNIAFRATFQNPDALLRHGQTGKIYMPLDLGKAMLIPQKATFEILDKKYVYQLKNHRVQAQQIQIGNELPHVYEVIQGLSQQDTLLVEGLRKVKNGQQVKMHFFKEQAEIIKELNQLHAE